MPWISRWLQWRSSSSNGELNSLFKQFSRRLGDCGDVADDCGETIRTLFNEKLSNISGESRDESWGLVTVSERSYHSGSRVDVPRISTLSIAASPRRICQRKKPLRKRHFARANCLNLRRSIFIEKTWCPIGRILPFLLPLCWPSLPRISSMPCSLMVFRPPKSVVYRGRLMVMF